VFCGWLWLTIGRALLGGALMMGLELRHSLLACGVLQAAGNLGGWWLAAIGKGSLGAATLPALPGLWLLSHARAPQTPVAAKSHNNTLERIPRREGP